jgi:hypothetical protein
MMHLKQDLGQFYNGIWCIKLNPFTVVLQYNYYDTFNTSVDTIV